MNTLKIIWHKLVWTVKDTLELDRPSHIVVYDKRRK